MRISTVVAGFVAALALTLGAHPVAAQQAAELSARIEAAPALSAASVAVRSPATAMPAAPQQRTRTRRSTTLMIVGGGIFLAGALIGDDVGTIMMVAGAVTGLYGLYLYLDQGAVTAYGTPVPASPF